MNVHLYEKLRPISLGGGGEAQAVTRNEQKTVRVMGGRRERPELTKI